MLMINSHHSHRTSSLSKHWSSSRRSRGRARWRLAFMLRTCAAGTTRRGGTSKTRRPDKCRTSCPALSWRLSCRRSWTCILYMYTCIHRSLVSARPWTSPQRRYVAFASQAHDQHRVSSVLREGLWDRTMYVVSRSSTYACFKYILCFR